jgi:arginyl-tRNA synthetase
MQILDLLRQRFATALSSIVSQANSPALDAESIAAYAVLVRPATDTRHGDYQANCAMSLAKQLSRNPREVASQIVAVLQVDELCHPPEIAGPGFINLRLKDSWLGTAASSLLTDSRLGVAPTASPKKILIDYSSPNVAKPMHVGHIRSTVIGDSLAKVLRFLGHHVITDNHLGDWGTQFGMVIYGFKHFGDETAFAYAPVTELSRLYRHVNRLMEFHKAVGTIDKVKQALIEAEKACETSRKLLVDAKDGKDKKQAEKVVQSASKKREAIAEQIQKLEETVAAVRNSPELLADAEKHPEIANAVLEETAKLHEGDETNVAMWSRFLPYCKDEINRVYERLNITFDYTLGESFYHSMLGDVVTDLRDAGLATDSEGAVCVFLPEFDAPMIVQKRDGAYLYATTDLATLSYRQMQFASEEILYVVDTRQSEHFEKLFAVARKMGFSSTRLLHVNFGTVLGDDGKPFKTRSGSSVGLESLLDDAVVRAYSVVCNPERSARIEPPLSDDEMRHIANVVGLGAIKYADLAHHRTSDYKFDLEKMVSLDGNTSAYVQYAYARTQGILAKGETNEHAIANEGTLLSIQHPAERALVLQLLRFGEALEQVRADHSPNFLVDYLYETARAYAVFNDGCPVLKAETEAITRSRISLVAATGKVLRQGLALLGIDVVSRM